MPNGMSRLQPEGFGLLPLVQLPLRVREAADLAALSRCPLLSSSVRDRIGWAVSPRGGVVLHRGSDSLLRGIVRPTEGLR